MADTTDAYRKAAEIIYEIASRDSGTALDRGLIEQFAETIARHCPDRTAISSALRSAPPVQEGWVVVPREPTPEMLLAMDEGYMPFGEMLAAYDFMIAAAPEPTGVSPTGETK